MSDLTFEDLDHYLLSQKDRIIHQVWFGTIPNKRKAKKAYEKLKIYRNSIRLKNPTWCIFEWNKGYCLSLIKSFYREHLELFLSYTYEIQRCDFIRYLILHRYGGWYMDMDYFCNRPLDEAMEKFKNDIYFVQTPNKTILHDNDHISNSLMYSRRGHTFWKKLIIEMEKAKDRYYYGKHLKVMFTTGPGILNRVYDRYKYSFKIRSLPWKLFHPYGIGDDKSRLNNIKDVYTIHLGKGSWEAMDSKYLLFVFKEWKIMLYLVILLLIYYSFNKLY